MPVTVENIHESCFRSYHALNLVLEYMQLGCPATVIKQIVDMLYDDPDLQVHIAQEVKDGVRYNIP